MNAASDPSTVFGPQIYLLQLIPGKGMGLAAGVTINKGQRIICEKPLLLSPVPSTTEDVSAVFTTTCRIKHDCLPNAHSNWNADMEWITVHAVRDIKRGEEITFSYAWQEPSAPRRETLQTAFGINCICRLCTSSPAVIARSDANRGVLKILNQYLAKRDLAYNFPGQRLKDCVMTIDILAVEYPGVATANGLRVYEDAFGIAIMHGDQARAKVFAERAYEVAVVLEGHDTVRVRQAAKCMEDLTRHSEFGTSNMWECGKEAGPKGLNEAAFEGWLWRQDFVD